MGRICTISLSYIYFAKSVDIQVHIESQHIMVVVKQTLTDYLHWSALMILLILDSILSVRKLQVSFQIILVIKCDDRLFEKKT